MESGRKNNRDAEAELNLPPGFRFHPTDEELIVHYLCKKLTHQFLPVPIIAEVDLYKHEPCLLPEKALFGHKEWYFFTPRDRKYPNGSRPNRTAGSGYWKATGTDKHITPLGSTRAVGIKKALVFYNGKAPKGTKTNWIMHEYRLADINRTTNKKGTLRLDDWVLCRLYIKKNNWQKEIPQANKETSFEDETTDSFDAVEETAFDGHKTPESEVENDVFLAAEVQQEVSNYLVVTKSNLSVAATSEHRMIKEDNDWFTELNLDDLQNTFTKVSSTTGLSAADYQDYYYTRLSPPMLPRIPSQPCMLPFSFVRR